MNFSTRSTQLELLDAPNISKADLWRNLYELELINKRLGGHNATLLALAKLMQNKEQIYRILDIGCGGGDTLSVIEKWADNKGFKVELTGIDLLPLAIQYAEKHHASAKIKYVSGNVLTYEPQQQFHICISSLFCHHLYSPQLEQILQKKRDLSTIGFVINDLHRHPLAYYSIKLLTALFSQSLYVKNDAPLSVAKGFRKKELQGLLEAQVPKKQIELRWIWAFRYMAIVNLNK